MQEDLINLINKYDTVYVFMLPVQANVKQRVKASILQRIHDGHFCRKCVCDSPLTFCSTNTDRNEKL